MDEYLQKCRSVCISACIVYTVRCTHSHAKHPPPFLLFSLLSSSAQAPTTLLARAKVRIGRPYPHTHTAASTKADSSTGVFVYPGRIITDLDSARLRSLKAVLRVRNGPGRAFVLPCGNERLDLAHGRYARLITRVDYRENAAAPVTKQTAEARWDRRRRAPSAGASGGWQGALHESMSNHTRVHGEDADPYAGEDD